MAKKLNRGRELIFNFGDKVVQFRVGDFDDDMDIDKLLKIDYENLFAEILTFPIVVNRFGLLAAEMDNVVREKKANLEIFEAKEKKRIRNDWEGAKKPTNDEVEADLIASKTYRVKREALSEAIRDKEYLYTIYMSAKDKSEKLNKLSLSIRTGDIDEHIIQKQINNVYFKIKKGAISDED